VDGRRTRTKKKVRTEERPNPTMIIPLKEETTTRQQPAERVYILPLTEKGKRGT
jgi:hypothetical protein